MSRERFNHQQVEKTTQEKWAKERIYETKETGKKKFVLDMFPYPSGEGLHVGHPKGYIATDIYSRFSRMNGYSVLHPMGWDAFGLPAENFALKHKVHPREAVEKNITTFKSQLEKIGFDYDWDREINTTDPAYYRWTQWIFLQLYNKGLAFQSNEPINWCPSCKTGLANEDLDGSVCERCGSQVEKRALPQWVLKITAYADRMLEDLEMLAWPQYIKEAQRNWIGRKEGVVVTHTVEGSELSLDTFSAYPAWLFADTFIVMAPEHPLVLPLSQGRPEEADVRAFVAEMSAQSDVTRREDKEKRGVFTGAYARDPLTGRSMPVWLANFALMDFGTGIIRCSAHDERDFAFAQKYHIPLKKVVDSSSDAFVNAHDNAGVLEDSGPFTGRSITPELIEEMVAWMVKEGFATRHVSYKIKDWVFSRQRYWGEPIPIIHCEKDGAVPVPENELPVLLPDVASYEPSGTGESPLATIDAWVNTTCPACGGPAKRETNTMPQWAGSSWYYLRFMDPKNDDVLVAPEKEKFFAPVDVYVGGDHAVRHLIYARFWHKFLYDIGAVSTTEPFARLEFLGFILAEDGRKMSKRYGNVINPDDVVKEYGADAFRVYEMFMGPFEGTTAWSTSSIAGCARFIERVWQASSLVQTGDVASLNTVLHQTVKKVAEDIESFKFNTAVSQMMIFLNALEKEGAIGKEQWSMFLRTLAPFAPHITEVLWEENGGVGSVHTASFPHADTSFLVSSTVTLVVQINSKRRLELAVSREATEEEVVSLALASAEVQKGIAGKEIKKKVYVSGRLLNLVVA